MGCRSVKGASSSATASVRCCRPCRRAWHVHGMCMACAWHVHGGRMTHGVLCCAAGPCLCADDLMGFKRGRRTCAFRVGVGVGLGLGWGFQG